MSELPPPDNLGPPHLSVVPEAVAVPEAAPEIPQPGRLASIGRGLSRTALGTPDLIRGSFDIQRTQVVNGLVAAGEITQDVSTRLGMAKERAKEATNQLLADGRDEVVNGVRVAASATRRGVVRGWRGVGNLQRRGREGVGNLRESVSESGLTLEGIGRFARLTRYYYREETLHGTGAPRVSVTREVPGFTVVGPRVQAEEGVLHRTRTPGLVDRDANIKSFADVAAHGKFAGPNNEETPLDPIEADAQRRATLETDRQELIDGEVNEFWDNFQESQEGVEDTEAEEEPDDMDRLRQSLEARGIVSRPADTGNLLSSRAAASMAGRGSKAISSVRPLRDPSKSFAKSYRPPRDPAIRPPVTVIERMLNRRREGQAEKLSRDRADESRLEQSFGPDVDLAPSQRTDGEPAGFWRRKDQRQGARAHRKATRHTSPGIPSRIRMNQGYLERATQGDTIHGRYRRDRIDRLHRLSQRDEDALNIRDRAE